jgi:hypothetical protein
VLLATTGGRVDVKWRGTAKSGYPLIERDRIMDAAVTIERRVELLEVSGAPIPSAAFEVPEGYAPALSLPYGGHDLTRADTMVNRVSSWWETASSWVLSFWR